jgi:hypothetical protein
MHTQPTSSALQGRSKQVQYMQFCPWGGSTYWPDQHRRPDPARHCFASSTMCACGLSVHLTFIQYREKLLPVLDTASPVSAYVLIILCDNQISVFNFFPPIMHQGGSRKDACRGLRRVACLRMGEQTRGYMPAAAALLLTVLRTVDAGL